MSMKRPVIGLLCGHQRENPDRYFVNTAYIQSVIRAGGTPILIPYQPKEQIFQILEGLDGLLVPGGVDLDPNRYGENPIVECGEVDPHWDELDLWASGYALQLNLPVLGICRGCQVLNVALGGTLIQDIPAQVKNPIKHAQAGPRWYATHDITLEAASLLGSIWGNAVKKVNSFHHQSIGQVGQGLRIVATAPDGIVEAVESSEHRFALGLQWHPELMIDHYPAALGIFEHFVRAAAAG